MQNNYDENHSVINSVNVAVGDTTFKYDYSYTSEPTPQLVGININGFGTQKICYDKLRRPISVESDYFGKHLEYLSNGDHTSSLVSKLQFSNDGINNEFYRYKYDEKGNIIEIRKNNILVSRYKYDGLSQLVREDNRELNKTCTFDYDAGGNTLLRTEYTFTLIDNLDFEIPTKAIPYSYRAIGWKDQLLSYNGEEFVYDEIGNPTTYRNKTLSWSHCRQLDSFGDLASYTYNKDGIRISKTTNGITTKYYLDGTKILMQEDTNGNKLIFYYGADGVVGFNINGENYFYKKSLQNDIIAIIDKNGQEIAKYAYDAWGNHKTYVLNNGQFVDISSNLTYTQDGLNNKWIPLAYKFWSGW